MKSPTLLLAAMMATITLALPVTTLAAESGHDHGAAPAKITLNAGQKWRTDESLRKGMSAIKAQVETALPAAHGGKLTPQQYDALGKDLTTQVVYIVQNCKLEPKADAQLHVLIGGLTDGIETLEGKQPDKERALGVVKVAQTLNTYGQYFEHAGWKPVKLPR